MTVEEFIYHVRVLNEASSKLTELMSLLQCDSETFIDDLGNNYGELILSLVYNEDMKGIMSDSLYEEFWNKLVYNDSVTDDEIEEFYNKLKN